MIIMRKRNVKIKQMAKKANVQCSIADNQSSIANSRDTGLFPGLFSRLFSLTPSSGHTWIYVKTAIAIVNQATSQVISQNFQHTAVYVPVPSFPNCLTTA